MNDCSMEQVINSFENDDWYSDYRSSSFDYDPNYYHHPVRFKLIHQTKKAYLLGSRRGEFWCPKSLIRGVQIVGDDLIGSLWNGFEAEFKEPEKPIDVFDAFAKLDIAEKKAEKKAKKKLEKKKQKKTDNWFLDWLGI